MGAIASGGVQVINRSVVQAEAITEAMIEQVAARERKVLERRELGYRGHAGAPQIAGQTVILVDDGVATGATMEAAVKALRRRQVVHVCLAVPVASREAHAQLKPLVDDWVSLMMPEGFRAVGEWYEEFPQVTDDEVTGLLAAARGLAQERAEGEKKGLGSGLDEELPR
jgi:putative phosphoribosyl transferase